MERTETNLCGRCGIWARLVKKYEPVSPLGKLNTQGYLTPRGRLPTWGRSVTVFKDLRAPLVPNI